jgi:hypothetical protein
MVEGLSRYIKASIEDGSLRGLPLHGIHPFTSHSQFVDDTMLMGTPTTQEARKFKEILSTSTMLRGTTINLVKSQIFFFNTPEAIQNHISRLLNIPKSSLPSNYLGIPLSDSVARNISWEPLLQSLTNHLNSWTFRSLNLAGRLVLLKYVLQAIPIYLFFSTLVAPF